MLTVVHQEVVVAKDNIVNNYLAATPETFALVFCGTGSTVNNGEKDGVITYTGLLK